MATTNGQQALKLSQMAILSVVDTIRQRANSL
jgi:hypothetical protein